jgi:ABC-type multidrug transport system ATPase subunit
MLIAEDLCKTYRGRRVLERVQLSCDSGQVCAVLGENGSGKSTLLRILCGLLEPDHGTVSIQGHPLGGGGVEARRRLGYVPDGSESLPDLSVRELSALVRSLKQLSGDAAVERQQLSWRERLGLTPAWHQRLGTLSFGQRKRACLLAALSGDPWLLILDEPSNGLDPTGVALVVELIEERRQQGKATLLGTNDVPFVRQLGARRWHLQGGKLAPES